MIPLSKYRAIVLVLIEVPTADAKVYDTTYSCISHLLWDPRALGLPEMLDGSSCAALALSGQLRDHRTADCSGPSSAVGGSFL